MPQDAIFTPVFVMFGLTIAVWFYMYSRRIPFIQGQGVKPQDLAKPGELARISPAHVTNPSDNLKNLCELPVLFYALALYLFVTGRVDETYLGAAWIFVALRIAHSLIHCTFNIIMLRFSVYALSSLTLFFMIGRASLSVFAA